MRQILRSALVLFVAHLRVLSFSVRIKSRLAKNKKLPFSFQSEHVNHFHAANSTPQERQLDNVDPHNEVEMTVICSLYRPEDFIDSVCQQLEEQSCKTSIELIFLLKRRDKETEDRLIASTLEFGRVLFIHTGDVGLYASWNIGIRAASASAITNLNDDDYRLPESFATQVHLLRSLPGADVIYTDFFQTDNRKDMLRFGPGYRVRVEELDLSKLLIEGKNFPHAFPVWKKYLHDELGFFDEKLESSADVDFWARCLSAKKQFNPVQRQPHSVYFVNPNGISTSVDSAGRRELASIIRRFSKDLIVDTIRKLPRVAKNGRQKELSAEQ